MYNEIILLGVMVSLLYTELTGLSAGLVVPGYLALWLHAPGRVAFTLVVALISVGICKLLSRAVILYGRRRFALLLLLTFFLGWLGEASGLLPGGVSVIGILIPGIAAREFDRQGLADTAVSLVVTTGIVACFMLLRGYPVLG